jgi:hypothetical protein
MKCMSFLAAVFALLLTYGSNLSTVHAQGALTPPGAPAPTMKSLDQIEPRIAISSAPFTISSSGSYYLTTNLTVSSGNAITIATNGVMLDLGGFTISSTAASATGYGILINTGLRNLTILNGFIQGGVTNNGSGVYSGSGFGYGIYYSVNPPVNVLVSKVSVSGCQFYGIYLGTGDATVVEACTVRTIGSYGIFASTVKSCGAADCGYAAIYGDQASDCRGASTGSGEGIYASAALNCYGYSTGSNAYGLSAATAQNCYGSSTGSNGTGIYSGTAENCFGVSTSSGYGIYVYYTASGCFGFSSTGTGLYALIANSCHGSTSSGTALSVTHNLNSY